ncbi:tetratricopeptide repeat protein [Reichenbachiella agarivorans]|uniref:histidine kinase n=1 Tax=Reichenbachiella agarivorans TaxID=2979464 RepID=A0ABY6CP48_9BACT|nr:tetratricopeptide repeat protein [Reichenbachiella agarivorans]UXP32287.1 tetratricopeptide repeat protein [Reichenbachiella agarivorans]
MLAALFGILFFLGDINASHPILISKSDSLTAMLDTTENVDSRVKLLRKIAQEETATNPIQALKHFEEILEIGINTEDQNLISTTYNDIGAYWYGENDLQESMRYYFLALEGLDEKAENYHLLCKVYNNIGWNFQKQKDYRRALDYYNICEKYCEQSDNISAVAHVLNNMGVVHKDLKEYDKALELLNQSLRLNRANGDIKRELFNINNIGVIYLERGDHVTANEYFAKALIMNQKRNDYFESANNLMNLGKSLFELNMLDAAEDTLKHALELSEITRSMIQKHEILNYLHQVKRKQNGYKEALDYYTAYNVLEDSLFKQGQYTDLIELESKYKVAQQERFLHESQNQLLRQQYLNTLYLAALIFALLLIGFLIWIYGSKKINERKLIALNKEIDTQNEKIQTINQNLEKTILQRTKVIQDQNNQLREFAFMNSHNIRRPLSNVLGLLSLLEDERNPEKISELIMLANQSAAEMDQIIQEVNRQLKEEEDL